jgi:outer membrane lipoprotein LolB
VPRLAGGWWLRYVLLTAIFSIAACASSTRAISPNDAQTRSWAGRLGLQIEASDSQPAQSFSASFELAGSAQAGQLVLLSPLGSTLAVLSWQPGDASLREGQRVRRFDTLDQLSEKAVGTALPIAALFEWLQGLDTQVVGWQVDVSQLPRRLILQRLSPVPQAQLRLVIDP